MTADAPGSRSAVAPATLPWHRRLSLRTRLLAVVVGLLVVALAATGVLTVAVLRPVLVQQKDDELVDVVRDDRALRRLLDGGPGAPRGAPSQFYVLVTRADGSAVRAARLLRPGVPREDAEPSVLNADETDPTCRSLSPTPPRAAAASAPSSPPSPSR